MHRMTKEQWHAFVMKGTRTGKVATARKDGKPHVVPVWFVLDGEDVVFTTTASSVKGQRCDVTGTRACASMIRNLPSAS
jgi:nitroimidazol reductase NimA-like FMN-containing flavoprotein (pyridoxamine 5'-phosphate oxidase superfamily)